MKSVLYLLIAYGAALAAAVLSILTLDAWLGDSSLAGMGFYHLLLALIADVGATVIVFGFSQFFRNSSVYDPYWSVAPPFIAAYWIFTAAETPSIRVLIIFAILSLWAVQLTGNWALRWRGMDDEDWRYRDIRRWSGRWFWAPDFVGIHLVPTLLVFAGMVPFYHATRNAADLNVLDLLALVVAVAAVTVEMVSDGQLRAFLKRRVDGGAERLRSGLRTHARHPSYFGEISFWWGVALFGFAASAAQAWWLFAGAAAILLLFVFVSVPLMNGRGLRRHEWYRQYMSETRAIVPLPRGTRYSAAAVALILLIAAVSYVLAT